METIRAQIAVPLVAAASTPGAERLVLPGPTEIVVLGVTVPALSALLGLVGVVLGQLLAPAPVPPLDLRRRVALVIALAGVVTGIVIASGQQPLVAMSWGIGLGYSGLAVAQALGTGALEGVKRISEAFVSMVASRIGASGKATNSKQKEDGDA